MATRSLLIQLIPCHKVADITHSHAFKREKMLLMASRILLSCLSSSSLKMNMLYLLDRDRQPRDHLMLSRQLDQHQSLPPGCLTAQHCNYRSLMTSFNARGQCDYSSLITKQLVKKNQDNFLTSVTSLDSRMNSALA